MFRFLRRTEGGDSSLIHSLTVVGGLAAMASLAAVTLSGTRLAAAAPPAGLGRLMVPAVSMGGRRLVRKTAGPLLSRAARGSKLRG